MSYNPTTWVAHQTRITAAALNNMEAGIQAGEAAAEAAVKFGAAQALSDAQKAQARQNIGAAAATDLTGGGRPIVYCWGDGLTEGLGGEVQLPDGANGYPAYSYPAWLGQSWDVVNLGARGEDVHAVMARQGADPIALQAAFTIPASKDAPVVVQTVTQVNSAAAGTGFTSRSGALVKLNRAVESPGLNPCVIAGVEGILYREIGDAALSDSQTYNYCFRRLADGEAVDVAAGTEVETFAMRHCRGGLAVIWMGANGGYASAADFADKVEAMAAYGQYDDYLVILSREFAGADLAAVKAALTDEGGVCHVIDLAAQLPYRGYALAGIPFNPVDTSGWATADAIKKNAPLLCQYLAGESGEAQYSGLYYSAWGYKAIGRLVNERLLALHPASAAVPVLQQKAVTVNGDVTPDSGYDGLSRVMVNVANTYAAVDEGKVVRNGALAMQSSRTVTENGTYDTTANDQMVVDVPVGEATYPALEALLDDDLAMLELKLKGVYFTSSPCAQRFVTEYATSLTGLDSVRPFTRELASMTVSAFLREVPHLSEAEYSGCVYNKTAMIEDLGLVLLGNFASNGKAEGNALLDSIANYSAVILQGVYKGSATSGYNTSMFYLAPALNQSYWTGMKDRNSSYDCFVTFTDNTTVALGGNKQVIIYGVP